MKVKIVYCILILSASQCAFFQTPLFSQRPADKFLRRTFHFDQDSIVYRLFLPEDYSPSKRYPLILTLHGSGENGSDGNHINDPIAETWAEDLAQRQNPAFVFSPQFPQLPDNMLVEYAVSIFQPRIDEILDSLIVEFPVDTSRLYITGYSAGSWGTWNYIYWYNKDRCAAAIPMSFGKNSEGAQITNIPVWAFHGENDNVVSVQGTRDMMLAIENAGIEVVYLHSQLGDIGLTELELDSLLRAGLNHIYTEYIGADHGGLVAPTYDDPLLHRWLFSQKKDFATGIGDNASLVPGELALKQNYPNPFNPSTIINYDVPSAGHVELKIYNTIGQEIRALVKSIKPVGTHQVAWDGRDSHGNVVTSGVYFYQLRAGSVVETRKMLFIR